jgi:hypothetical protein
MANTVRVKAYNPVVEELQAGAAGITPGMLLQLDSAGDVIAHGVAASNVGAMMFALEDELQGKGITENYADDDKVQVWMPRRGDIVNAILADGETISIGDFLESDGNGHLQEVDTDAATADTQRNAIVGVAIQAVTTSGATARLQVRIV